MRCPVPSDVEAYVGYYKICCRKPLGYFEITKCLLKGSAGRMSGTVSSALDAAFAAATSVVAAFPESDALAACQQARMMFSWELDALGLLRREDRGALSP